MLRMDKRFLKKREIIILAALAAVCAGALLLFSLAPQGNTAAVYYDGELIESIPLSKKGVYSIDADLPVTLKVEDGGIHFINSQCPDKLCEGFGLIGDEHEYAICMPAKVVVMIEAPE